MTGEKDFFGRMAELIKEDPELHDAFVRLINAMAETHEIANQYRKKKLEKK